MGSDIRVARPGTARLAAPHHKSFYDKRLLLASEVPVECAQFLLQAAPDGGEMARSRSLRR
jgi:hypothetical protein